MKCRLRKCCWVISLRVGCMISALLLIFFELMAVPLRNAKPCCDSLEGVLAVVNRVLEIVNFVGCLMLFVASFVKTSVLVSLFLATSLLHSLLYPAFLVAEVVIWNADIVYISMSVLGIVLGIYIWIVALAFYFECRDNVFKDDGTSPDRRKKGSIKINSLDV
ncbi:uncharacterized protein LOC108138483 [Drosophila elegans]|uniref:uncharacterized protein LOC108138483 n=1 Tax=Drosophila elegans TaxID=30023 RepID=UPI0007E8771F|nr:uncharacterized protein LOC108138483 [Drosophila elegans]